VSTILSLKCKQYCNILPVLKYDDIYIGFNVSKISVMTALRLGKFLTTNCKLSTFRKNAVRSDLSTLAGARSGRHSDQHDCKGGRPPEATDHSFIERKVTMLGGALSCKNESEVKTSTTI